ncbi:hypothetical protein AB0I98_16885 [Streptomyces sp. NPDC050211]|uniref:hypothetical protein n=1 Tax=Streptomyces sp. NPDC050211 TaxID=3154932 RepID=UPI003439FC51
MEHRERMSVEELLQRHDVDPALLDPAPADPDRAQFRARFALHWTQPCSACGKTQDCHTSRAVTFPEHGTRWVDLCRDHMLATMPEWHGPSTVEGILQDIREVVAKLAAEHGTPARVRVWTDEDGWHDLGE